MWKVRELADKVTNVVMNYTDIEAKVREATNDEAWGPTGTIKHELSQATFSYDQFPEVMGMCWRRIAENKRSPRRIYKSLLLLHHLLLHGSDRVVRAAQDRLYEIRSLQDYHVVYEPGFNLDAIIPPSGVDTKDGELNVRMKAKELVELIGDEERLREERKKSRKNRDKYVGIGSDKMMTSKWDSNSDYGGGYDDEYGKKSRSPSPPFGKSKPYRDSESDFKKSSSSNSFNNNHNSSSFKSKPAPPSPGFEATDEFNPRAEEKTSADFGDFTSAATTTTKSISVSSIAAVPSSDGGDFADFQSAFGGSTQAIKIEEQTVTTKSADLLGLSLDLGGSTSSNLPSNNASLLSQDLFSNHVVPPVSSMSASNSMDFASFGQSMPSPVGSGQFSPTGFLGANNAGFSPTTSNFGGNSLLTPVLEPAKSNETGSANSNSTASNNNNVHKQSLKGTTWSDLNITIDDLNLGRSNSRNAAGNKTPMNQLKTNSTSNSLGGGLL